MKSNAIRCAVAFLGAVALSAHAATEAEIQASFNPYKGGFPSAPGIQQGLVINKGNVEQFKDAMVPEVAELVKKGDLEIRVGASHSAPYPKVYIDASVKNAGKAKISANGGHLDGYETGRPFPGEPSTSDPEAGLKIAWNHLYSLEVPDDIRISRFLWDYKDMKSGRVNRSVTYDTFLKSVLHRTVQPPEKLGDGAGGFFQYTLLQVLDPPDLRNTALLLGVFDDQSKFDDGQLYLGFQRRVRRITTSNVTDPFLGSNMMIEEFHGYNGRVTDMKWKYLGTKNVLMPFYVHTEAKLDDARKFPDWTYTAYHGQGNCHVDAPWSLRKVYVLEMTPVDPGHPISKRILYIDAESYFASVNITYDRKGELWKEYIQGVGHPDGEAAETKKFGLWTWDAGSVIDLQAQQCTTYAMNTRIEETPMNVYNLSYLRSLQ